jgi:hypothetical protein
VERPRLGERGRTAADEHRLHVGREAPTLPLELGEERVGVCSVLAGAADGGDEVAVAAAVRAERQVDVEVPDAAQRLTASSRRRG